MISSFGFSFNWLLILTANLQHSNWLSKHTARTSDKALNDLRTCFITW